MSSSENAGPSAEARQGAAATPAPSDPCPAVPARPHIARPPVRRPNSDTSRELASIAPPNATCRCGLAPAVNRPAASCNQLGHDTDETGGDRPSGRLHPHVQRSRVREARRHPSFDHADSRGKLVAIDDEVADVGPGRARLQLVLKLRFGADAESIQRTIGVAFRETERLREVARGGEQELPAHTTVRTELVSLAHERRHRWRIDAADDDRARPGRGGGGVPGVRLAGIEVFHAWESVAVEALAGRARLTVGDDLRTSTSPRCRPAA